LIIAKIVVSSTNGCEELPARSVNVSREPEVMPRLPLTYNGNELADGERFQLGSQLWEIDYNRTSATGLANFTSDYVSGSFVTVTAVPEPSTLVLLGIGGVLACWARRRKSRRSSAILRVA
jgi:hypothetical protein